jgi:GH15 family glucan-1,4-alpha-glucosidase
VPRFDSPSAFGALLDRTAGRFRFGPVGETAPLSRRYEPGTLVLETTWSTDGGWVVIRDALTVATWSDRSEQGETGAGHEPDYSLVRVATCIDGEAEIEMECLPRFQYGASPGLWSAGGFGEAIVEDGDGTRLALNTDLDLTLGQGSAHGSLKLKEGESAFCSLAWGPGTDSRTRSAPEAGERVDDTVEFWRQWLSQGTFPDHPWRIHLQRSALVLKGLTYAPSGALLAAATTSLPETPGGVRNWDYRYSWIRDSTFALWSLHSLGFDEEAKAFLKFVRARAMEADGNLQIMYGIDGEHDLTESTLDHLSGYEGARPVRIGNGAFDQHQHDVWGALMDAIYVNRLALSQEKISDDARELITRLVESAIEAWPEPDQGIWEARGAPRHYVSSKLMIWVAVDRGARLAAQYGRAEVAAAWNETADRIKAEIIERGCRDGIFRQHYETDALDASVLLMPLVRFLPYDDERIRNTVLAVREGLDDRGLILRYLTEETDDGLHGREGTFLICSFWMVSALSEIGEAAAARKLCERLLSSAGSLNLFAEELDSETNRHLGNFPQAFTHLALINAVSHVVADERRDADPGTATAVFSEMRHSGA